MDSNNATNVSKKQEDHRTVHKKAKILELEEESKDSVEDKPKGKTCPHKIVA